MIAASLFSGIGAPECAMPQWQWPWHAEIEPFPNAVMRARHRDSANLGDVTRQGFADHARSIARPHVLVFGSPCQSYSVAGKRLGLDDPRGNLALVALGIVARLEPRWFVFENVPGLLSSSEGRDFGLFLRAVDELGYSGAWTMLDAQFAGLAQRRDRVFFVGHSGDWRYPAAVLFEPESLCGHSAPSREAGEGVANAVRASASPRGHGHSDGLRGDGSDNLIARSLNAHPGRSDGESETFVPVATFQNTGHGWWNESPVAQTIRTPDGGGSMEANIIAHSLRADGFDASEDGTGRGTPLIAFQTRGSNIDLGQDATGTLGSNADRASGGAPMIAFSCKDHGADAGALAPTLRAMPHDGSHANAGGQLAVAFQSSQSGMRTGDAHATLDSHNGSRRHHGALVGSTVRRLTPRECECLQGFPDDYTAVTYRGKGAADGPRYKALGNSMAVPVMRWILSRIGLVEANAIAERRDAA